MWANKAPAQVDILLFTFGLFNILNQSAEHEQKK